MQLWLRGSSADTVAVSVTKDGLAWGAHGASNARLFTPSSEKSYKGSKVGVASDSLTGFPASYLLRVSLDGL